MPHVGTSSDGGLFSWMGRLMPGTSRPAPPPAEVPPEFAEAPGDASTVDYQVDSSESVSDAARGVALRTLQQRFAELAGQFHDAQLQLTEYLARGGTPPASGGEVDLAPVLRKVEGLEDRLGRIEQALTHPPAPTVEAFKPVISACQQLAQMIKEGFKGQTAKAEELKADVQTGLAHLQEALTPPPVEAPTGPDLSDWRRALFGDVLAGDRQLAPSLDALANEILAGSDTASTLAGQLLVFRHAPPERKPQLLKDLGEAYYRCFPKTDDVEDALESALAHWLQRACEQAGYQNSIELVPPGSRFDATRHTTTDRGGVEVSQPLGWVVLKDRDKVYTKALVAVR